MCGVLDAVNSVFFRIMDDEAESGGIRYDETQALYAGSETQNGGAAAQLHILDEPAADAETSGEDALAELRKNEVQARYVASLVRDLLEEGTLTDRNTGNVRRVEKNDIAILLRAPRGAAEDYVYALEREGIDCVAQADSRHFDTIEVRALLDATVKLRDGKKATDMKLSLAEKLAVKKALEKIEGTDIEKILKEYNVI